MSVPVAVITGGARGLGRAFVEEVAGRGFRAVFCYRANRTAAESVAAGVGVAARRPVAVHADVAEPEGLERLAATARELGPVQLLINNAGLLEPTTLAALTRDGWARAWAVNVSAPCFLTQSLAPDLAEQGGAVLNVSSSGGVTASMHGAAYGATKAALIGLTRTLAAELAPHVRVNALAPGPVATDMWDDIPSDQQAEVERTTPLRRVATPRDMARAGVDVSCWPDCTGQVVVVDGGRVMR